MKESQYEEEKNKFLDPRLMLHKLAHIEITETSRGFAIGEFQDAYGEKCTIQESSLDAGTRGPFIWLGMHHPSVKRQVNGQWVDVEFPIGTVSGSRMHLTREMAAALIPHLTRFANTGSLQ